MSFYVKGDVERHQRHDDEVLSEYVSPTITVGLNDMHKLKEFRNCLPTYVLLTFGYTFKCVLPTN